MADWVRDGQRYGSEGGASPATPTGRVVYLRDEKVQSYDDALPAYDGSTPYKSTREGFLFAYDADWHGVKTTGREWNTLLKSIKTSPNYIPDGYEVVDGWLIQTARVVWWAEAEADINRQIDFCNTVLARKMLPHSFKARGYFIPSVFSEQWEVNAYKVYNLVGADVFWDKLGVAKDKRKFFFYVGYDGVGQRLKEIQTLERMYTLAQAVDTAVALGVSFADANYVIYYHSLLCYKPLWEVEAITGAKNERMAVIAQTAYEMKCTFEEAVYLLS